MLSALTNSNKLFIRGVNDQTDLELLPGIKFRPGGFQHKTTVPEFYMDRFGITLPFSERVFSMNKLTTPVHNLRHTGRAHEREKALTPYDVPECLLSASPLGIEYFEQLSLSWSFYQKLNELRRVDAFIDDFFSRV